MFNSFISIIINVIFLSFDLNIFSWLHISQINTEMFLIFFKFMGFTLQNHKRGRETKRVKKKKKRKENMEIRENYEKRERVYSNYEQINILSNIKQLK